MTGSPSGHLDQRRPAAGRRPVAPTLGGDVVVILAGLLLLGVLCGVLWWLLVDPAQFTKRRDGATMDEVALGRLFAADGWYTVIALAAGALAGAVLTRWRDRDELTAVLLLLVGSGMAAAAMALVGHGLGPADPSAALASAPPGARVPVELSVTAWPAYLAWPAGTLLGSLMVLWSAPRERVG